MKAGITPKTARPELAGLMVVPKTLNLLAGERNAPELPIPVGAVERYAERYGYSRLFVQLVQAYDRKLMDGAMDKMKARQKPNGGGKQTTQTVL